MQKNLNPVSAYKTDIHHLALGDYTLRKHTGKGSAVHHVSDVVTHVEHEPSEAAYSFLLAGLIVSNGDTADWCENPVKKPYNLAHRDVRGRPGQPVSAMLAGSAVDPTLGFHIEHDMLKKPLGDAIGVRQVRD